MKKAKAKAKAPGSNEIEVNSAKWKELRQRQYRRRLAVPSGMKPEDVPFQKKAMAEVDKLPVSEGGKGK
jgi:HSP20 family molecular chaperone IbpA